MKLSKLFLSSLLLVSCGTELEQGNGSPEEKIENMIGEIRTIDESDILTDQEKQIIKSACADIARKESVLSDYANNGNTIKYQNAISSCGAEAASKSNVFNVTVSIENSRFAFVSENVTPAFKYFLGASSGPMEKVCQLAQASAPMPRTITGDSDPIWISAFSGKGGNCSEVEETNCIYLETGLITSNAQSYRIRDIQFFAVNSDSQSISRGFAREMSQVSLCDDSGAKSVRRMYLLDAQN